jgi:beta-galactosidase
VRPEVEDAQDDRPADAPPTEAVTVTAKQSVLKPWILPTGNDFIQDPTRRHVRPQGEPDSDFAFVQSSVDAFMPGWQSPVGGGMGRLPSSGVAWYRRTLDIANSDNGASIFLDVDGAMSYAMVWLNGHLVGGWPFGYSSWRVDLTPYVNFGGENQLAIRLDNPPNSSRWYPGGGIYRNVWLTKTNPIHVSQWGTFVTTSDVSANSAKVNLRVSVDNDSDQTASLQLSSEIFALDSDRQRIKC